MAKRIEPKALDYPCPKCGGKLKLSGAALWQEDQTTNTFQGFREYECENCGHKFRAHEVTLIETIQMG
jgi:predicted RNA-binding Zn-ribbon protein involved in translation (DUF1610 family)